MKKRYLLFFTSIIYGLLIFLIYVRVLLVIYRIENRKLKKKMYRIKKINLLLKNKIESQRSLLALKNKVEER
jgi:hypothetical protein